MFDSLVRMDFKEVKIISNGLGALINFSSTSKAKVHLLVQLSIYRNSLIFHSLKFRF